MSVRVTFGWALAALALGAASFAAPATARAQTTPPAGDLDLIATCLANAKDEPLACLGRIQKPCLEEAGGETTLGAVRCAQREQAVWDARAVLARLVVREKLSASRRTLFDEAAVAWAPYRLKSCLYEASIYEGGSLAQVVLADCMMRESAERAMELDREADVLRNTHE